jgi:sulfatase maturation enzyme AslB (radical SAM superfamily)
MSLSLVHQEPNGQVSLYQTEDRYHSLLFSRHGLTFSTYRQLWQKSALREILPPFPLSLDLAINTGCQLSCLMCPHPSRPDANKNKLMDFSLYQNILAQAKEHHLPSITYGLGGEPLLNPSLVTWIKMAEKAGIMDIRLGTNGLLLTPELTDKLLDSGLCRLEISIDAIDKKTYSQIRKGGDFDRLIQNINLFLEKRSRLGLTFPLLRLSFLKLSENDAQLEPFLTRWENLADMISIQNPIWFPGTRLKKPNKAIKNNISNQICSQSWQRLGINYDGQLWPCCSWFGEKLLDLKASKISIFEAWNSELLQTLRTDHLNGTPPKSCQICLSSF